MEKNSMYKIALDSNHNESGEKDKEKNKKAIIANFNWMEKLKPSTKNKLIIEKCRNLSDNNKSKEDSYNKDNQNLNLNLNSNSNKIINETDIYYNNSIQNNNSSKEISNSSNDNNKSYLEKWNKCIFENKLNLNELNNLTEKSQIFMKNDLNQTTLSDDLENINNIMEEKIKINLTENGFLKQSYHSIMPFFLIQNKEVHRMCLSDYELKLFYKTYNKRKNDIERKNPYESYREGIIKFYKGKYLEAYSHFKSAQIKKENDCNIVKWLAFTSLILLFCNKNIDFTNIKEKVIDNIKTKDDKDLDLEDNMNFYCCSSRKGDNKNKDINSILKNKKFLLNKNIVNSNNSSYLEGCLGFNSNIANISQANLAKEIIKLLKKLLKKENKNSNLTKDNIINNNTNNNTNNNNISNFNLDSENINNEEFKNYSHEVEAW
jgi:hypothetical protein